MIDLIRFTHQNLWLSRAGELVVRDAVERALDVDDFANGSSFVWGQSVRSPNTGEVWHYLATRGNLSGEGTLHVCDEDFMELTSVSIGAIPPRPVITLATISSPHVSSLELVIGGPDIPTLYGFAGSGLIYSEKQESTDPNATAIDVPRGIVAGFAGRAVVANGKNLYFSNGYGTRVVDGVATFTGPRTYTAVNIGDMAAIVYSLHTSEQGALIIVTDSGVWGLPPQAVASGVQVRDLFEKISSYGATDYGQTALHRSTVYGLSDLGIVRASVPALPEIPLDEVRLPRSLSEPIEVPDYRSLRLWAWEQGIAVSQPHAVCLVDDDRGFRSWQTDSFDMSIVGVLEEQDGASLFVSPSRVWGFHGYDHQGSTLVGVAAGALEVDPAGSQVVREVTTSSDSPGAQLSAVRGSSVRRHATPQRGAKIGVDVWSATEVYGERAIRSRRHRFAVRTDDPTIEVGAEHPGSRLGLLDVTMRGQGRRRP